MFATRVNRLLISSAIAAFALIGCKGHGSSNSIPQADTNWTWEAGSDVAGSMGYYISQGTATTSGQPSGRSGAMTWLDSKGQFWVFSGAGGTNDMWAFNPSNLQWAWMSGSNPSIALVAPGVYGTSGVSAAVNVPGQRSAGSTWVDSAGTLWMFGGYGVDKNGLTGYLNDIWSFNTTTGWWTWEGTDPNQQNAGSLAATPSWGTVNVAAASNQPNPRSNAAQWQTASGVFYMFGGQGYFTGGANISNASNVQNDLWQFNPSTKLWTWVNGAIPVINSTTTPPTITPPSGVYGNLRVPAATNQPGGRQSATTWTDTSGNFWMFGGTGIDSTGANGQLNDLWEYNPTKNQWTWMNGANTINAVGVYGTNAVGATTNQPGARSGAIAWTDSSNNFWMFGGYGINTLGSLVELNDLWQYLSASNEWVWVNGSYYGNVTGVYGTVGVLTAYNMPGSRYGASGWKDSSGNFWMFGGNGYDAAGSSGRLADTWRFLP